MPELLVREGRLIVAGGRLITTANGAPCCCGGGSPPLPCECVPNASIVNDGTYPLCPGGTGLFPPYRVLTFTSTYTSASVETTTRARQGIDYRPFVPVNIQEEETVQRITATVVNKTVCRSAAGTLVTGWRIEFQGSVTSSTRGVVEQSMQVFVSENIETYLPDIVRQLLAMLPLASDEPFTERCNFEESNTEILADQRFPPRDLRQTRTLTNRGEYANSATGGRAVDAQSDVFASREVTYLSYSLFVGTETVDIERLNLRRRDWTYGADLCDGSGGGTGDRPGGCNGCGDPARLTLV